MPKKLTDEEIQQRKELRDVADIAAQKMGYKDIHDAEDKINYKMDNAEAIARASLGPDASETAVTALADEINLKAVSQAGALVTTLSLKTFYQEFTQSPIFGFMRDRDEFDDIHLKDGNSKEFGFDLLTGCSIYNMNEYVPSNAVDAKIYSYTIQMYQQQADGTKVLSPQAYQFRKRLSINEPIWMPYFKSNKLFEFISLEREKMRKTYAYFKFDQIIGLITANAKLLAFKANAQDGPQVGGRLVKGTAKNAFEAFSQEIYPLINDCITGDINACFGGTNYNSALLETNPSDIIMLMPNKLEAVLRAGISSQLFNAQLFDIKRALNEGNVRFIGNKISIPGAYQWDVDNQATPTQLTHNLTAGNESTPITKLDQPYIPDNMIIMFNKHFIKHIFQIERALEQFYTNNMYHEYVLHVWACYDILPWCPFVVYVNDNLTTLPNSDVVSE